MCFPRISIHWSTSVDSKDIFNGFIIRYCWEKLYITITVIEKFHWFTLFLVFFTYFFAANVPYMLEKCFFDLFGLKIPFCCFFPLETFPCVLFSVVLKDIIREYIFTSDYWGIRLMFILYFFLYNHSFNSSWLMARVYSMNCMMGI